MSPRTPLKELIKLMLSPRDLFPVHLLQGRHHQLVAPFLLEFRDAVKQQPDHFPSLAGEASREA